MDFASPPRRLQRQVHYPKLRFGFGVRSRSRGILTLRYRARQSKRPVRLGRGGGEIRTHEAFRPSGFQDRRIQPLCHPSKKKFGRENCATTLTLSKRAVL